MVYAVVTGGGTSGHVIPAMAILEGLLEAGHTANELRYVGSRRGIERSLMVSSDVAGEYLPISGLQRSLSPRGIARNLALPFRLVRSRLMARALIKRWQPHVVVSVGGYASEPMSAAAIAAGVPLVCVSYDRTPVSPPENKHVTPRCRRLLLKTQNCRAPCSRVRLCEPNFDI